MKSKIIMSFIFLATLATILFFPKADSRSIPTIPPEIPIAGKKAKIEVVFVLDTTSSMSGMIQAAKDKIWSIASTMAQADPAPEIRMGLVAFRDKGDRYVTKKVDLSTDLDSMYSTLMDFRAEGGGDGPESVNQALFEAVNHMSWSQDQDSYKVVFLVGDAP
ncbi:MAG: vWA domain-containing protein, partial [Pseudomonadota bacterium]